MSSDNSNRIYRNEKDIIKEGMGNRSHTLPENAVLIQTPITMRIGFSTKKG
jgi:hypothetical protein